MKNSKKNKSLKGLKIGLITQKVSGKEAPKYKNRYKIFLPNINKSYFADCM